MAFDSVKTAAICQPSRRQSQSQPRQLTLPVVNMQINKQRAAILLITVACAAYVGVDVIPGSIDEVPATAANPGNDFSMRNGRDMVVRLTTHKGEVITEEMETVLVPLLEGFEEALKEEAALAKAPVKHLVTHLFAVAGTASSCCLDSHSSPLSFAIAP